MKNEKNKTCMRSGTRPSPEGTLVIRSVLLCVQLMDSRRTTKRPDDHSQDEGRDKAEKSKSRPQRGGGFSLNLDLFVQGVSR